MKIKGIIYSLFSLLLLTIACDDDLNSVGLSTKPDSDNVSVYADTVYLSGELATKDYTQTVKFDSIYYGVNTINTFYFLLGNFQDPLFGSLKADFLSQYAPASFTTDSIKNNRADSVKLIFEYSSWLGDSIAPMVAKVYPVNKGVSFSQEYHYTNIDLYDKYVSPAKPWVTLPYTARDLSQPYSASTTKSLTFDLLNTGIDTMMINEWRRNPATFESIISFTKFFPGLYVTTTSGDGNLLKISTSRIHFYYSRIIEKEEGGYTEVVDSTRFFISPEVILSSQYINKNEDLTTPNPEVTFVKAPAGVYTQYTLPLNEIKEKINGREINSIKFAVSAYAQDDWKYALGAPTTMMLIDKDSLTTFFQTPHIVSSPTSYKATYSNYKYDFGDISGVIKKGISEGKDELNVMLVPVVENSSSVYYSGTTYNYPLFTSYDITPTGVKLKKGSSPDGTQYLRLEILSSALSNR